MEVYFRRIRVYSGPFGKSIFILNYTRLLISDPTSCQGTSQSFGPEHGLRSDLGFLDPVVL